MLEITDRAAAQILQSAKKNDIKEIALRLAPYIKPDGSIEYNRMGFDEVKDGDIQIHCEGVKVVYEPSYQDLLEDAVMDFVEIEAGEFSFIFLNPNDPNYVPPKK
ncbi:MAG: iron-sulfur cluster assembly accessory protein [Proteobacteria bacterium]|nr:iron-sulfur cluster assembly accessory protein [Pseudomonadota bacterium]